MSPQNHTTETLLNEDRVFRPLPKVMANAVVNPQDLTRAKVLGDSNPLGFWEDAAEELQWFKRWTKVLDESNAPSYAWFSGALCNVVHNALDRHLDTANRHKLALIWEGEDGQSRRFTYFDMHREVSKLAGLFLSLGIEQGDRILIYMPSLPETVFAMLAAAKIGAVHSTVFGGFSAGALADRIADASPKLLFTVDAFYRNGRLVELKPIADAAIAKVKKGLAHGNPMPLQHTIVVQRAPSGHVGVPMQAGHDLWYHEAMQAQTTNAVTQALPADAPLFMLYTSGTTGKPKALVHNHGGYMVGVHRTMRWVFDIKPTDIFWCTAEPAWITGHSYGVYGPLMAGATAVLYEGHPLYPAPDRLWDMVERWGVNILYTVPTIIRMLQKADPEGTKHVAKHDISSLRLLATVGEPISPETWMWFYRCVGRSQCPVLDTWWQTETGMIMLSPLPISALKPGSVARPFPAVDVDIVDADGQSVPCGRGGYLVVKRPWPAMASGVFHDDETFKRLYWERFQGVFWSGDVARRDDDGYIWIQGRADDVMVIAGHRVGTAEMEAALVSHSAVAECAIIGVPDAMRGEVAKAFVVINEAWCDEHDIYLTLDDDKQITDGPDGPDGPDCPDCPDGPDCPDCPDGPDCPEGPDDPDLRTLAQELKHHVRRELGPVAVLRDVTFRYSLPRNRSGKIMRRVLRSEEEGSDMGDISTLDFM